MPRHILLANIKMNRRLFALTNDMTFYREMKKIQKILASSR